MTCFCTLRDSDALRSSLITADRASGLMPCSHSLTHMDRDSMSKPVFSNLEISSRTVRGRTWQDSYYFNYMQRKLQSPSTKRLDLKHFTNTLFTVHCLPHSIEVCICCTRHNNNNKCLSLAKACYLVEKQWRICEVSDAVSINGRQKCLRTTYPDPVRVISN